MGEEDDDDDDESLNSKNSKNGSLFFTSLFVPSMRSTPCAAGFSMKLFVAKVIRGDSL